MLLKSLEVQKLAVERLIPDLQAMYTVQKNKPQVEFYDGWEEVKKIYWQALQAKEIYAIGSTQHLSGVQASFFDTFVASIKEKGIMLCDILSSDSKEDTGQKTKETLKGLYDMHVLPKKFESFKTDILVWDNHVALITLEEPFFGTVMTNPLLAQTFKTVFKVMKMGLKEN